MKRTCFARGPFSIWQIAEHLVFMRPIGIEYRLVF